MKKAIIFFVVLIGFSTLYAQSSTYPIYIILSAKTSGEDGIIKVSTNNKLFKTPHIIYFIDYRSKGIHLFFEHNNFNTSELSKIRKVKANDQKETLHKSTSFLKTIAPIDLDVLLPKWTKEQALAFRDSLQGKKIYIIDRNETKNKQIVLVEVTCHKSAW